MAILKVLHRDDAKIPGVEVVFFDVGGTLVHSDLDSLGRLQEALRLIGYDLGRDRVAKANDRARQAVSRRRRRLAARLEAVTASRMWLDHLAEELDLDLRGNALERELALAVQQIESGAREIVDPDAPALLAALRRRGLRLGVVSNWSADLPDYLRSRGLLERFDAVIASEAVGSAKPHREIFLRALSALNCTPRRAVHVGDDYWADVVGARSLGIRAVLIDRTGGAPREGCVTISRLRDLKDLL
jgi:HAD superfamily hydrolase (TIGR01549 family)